MTHAERTAMQAAYDAALAAHKDAAHDEPCCWCNDQGADTSDGESHPCAWCGA